MLFKFKIYICELANNFMPQEFKYRQQFYQDYFNSQSGRTFSLNIEAKIKSEEYLLAKEILPLMPKNHDAAILDIGCGFGSLIYMLKQNGYRNLKGIDLSEGQVKVAKEIGLSEVELQDLLPYLKSNTNQFDAISGIDIIEHFSKDELMEVLKAVFHALKPNGIAIFRTPNLDAPFATLFANGDFTHENYLNYSSANQVLLTAGFKEIQVKDSLMLSNNFIKEIFRKITWLIVKSCIKLVVFATARSTRAMVFSPNLLIKAKKL